MALKTEKSLIESFKKLLSKKPISKITIKELTDDCKMSRMTFYYHFTDIYDLARYVSVQDALKIEQLSGGNDKTHLISIIKSFYENQEITFNIYTALDGSEVLEYLTKSFEGIVSKLLYNVAIDKKVTIVNIEFLKNYILNAVVGCVKKWFDNNMDENPNELADKLYLLTLGLINTATNETTKEGDNENENNA